MHYSQKLTYVVCTQYRAEMKLLLHISQINPTVLHLSGIAAACGIYSQGLTDNLRWNGFFLLFAAALMVSGFLLYEVLGWQVNGLLGLLTGIKSFVYGTFPAFYLLFAGLPGILHPGIQPNPDNVKLLCHIANLIKSSYRCRGTVLSVPSGGHR